MTPETKENIQLILLLHILSHGGMKQPWQWSDLAQVKAAGLENDSSMLTQSIFTEQEQITWIRKLITN